MLLLFPPTAEANPRSPLGNVEPATVVRSAAFSSTVSPSTKRSTSFMRRAVSAALSMYSDNVAAAGPDRERE